MAMYIWLKIRSTEVAIRQAHMIILIIKRVRPDLKLFDNAFQITPTKRIRYKGKVTQPISGANGERSMKYLLPYIFLLMI
jgi:hypothetical protein